jgi:ABC-type glutathione transport system ATPase component
MRASDGTTFVIVSHEWPVLDAICDRIVAVEDRTVRRMA